MNIVYCTLYNVYCASGSIEANILAIGIFTQYLS